MNNLASKIEAIIFFKGEPISRSFLAKTLAVSTREIDTALEELKESLSDRGVKLLFQNEDVMLGTDPEFSELIESISKEDVERELTKAALETLSVILYRAPVSKREIDFIRGVNSGFILRNLLVRGLITKKTDLQDKRSHIYEPSFELLSHLGVTSINEIPKYEEITSKIQAFLGSKEEDGENSEENER